MATILLLDDDVSVTEALALGLESPGRVIVTCNDIEGAELLIQPLKPDVIFADVQFSGAFGFEGLEFVDFVREQMPDSRIVLMTGRGSEELRSEALRRGAAGFLEKPFALSELDPFLAGAPAAADAARTIRVPDLTEIVVSSKLDPVFQPVFDLREERLTVAGYEALARFRHDSPFVSPEVLFQYALRKKRVVDLEIACAKQALVRSGLLLPDGLLFLNVHPRTLSSPRIGPALLEAVEAAGRPAEQIVFEITEQAAVGSGAIVAENLRLLREAGARFALDDVGIAYSHLMHLEEIRPSFLKISQHFGTEFEHHDTRAKIVNSISALAADLGADVILEGIERRETLEAARAAGIRYGQGFFLARPGDADSFTSPTLIPDGYR